MQRSTFAVPRATAMMPAGGGVYLILSSDYCPNRDPLAVARRALAGGAALVQLREKSMPAKPLLAYGAKLAALCRARGVPLIVNDDPELALALAADGVHLGQEDAQRLGLTAVRRRLGPHRLLGLSTHSLAEFTAAQESPVDYAAYGPLFPTPAKPYHIGTAELPAVLAAARRPVVFIGGINRQNAAGLAARGCRWLAVIRDIVRADDVAGAVREYNVTLAKGAEPCA